MKSKNLVNLEKINKTYQATIWDTCALTSYIKKDNGGIIGDAPSFARILMRKIPLHKTIFMPNEVIEEYNLKKNGNGVKDNSEKNLAKMIKKEERILSIKDFPLGPKVEKRDKFLKKILNNYSIDIQETDIRIVSWAIELSKFYSSPVAIISNDLKGIARFRSKLIATKKISPENMGLLPRRGFDLYGFN